MNFMQGFGGLGGLDFMGGQQSDPNAPLPDTQEKIYVSALALIKMLKHSRAGVPMEVMGLMLGEIVDEYTVNVIDVFAMPQSGTSVSVESVDPVFQQEMLDMLQQTERRENVVGWYHSHPSFGCWLSSVDQQTQMSFEQLNPKAVALVIDPIQSVRGRVVIDAFRLINPTVVMSGQEPRQTTGVEGHLNKPNLEAQLRGVGIQYYSINIAFRTNELENQMLSDLYKSSWRNSLELKSSTKHSEQNVQAMKDMVGLAKLYTKAIEEEIKCNGKDEKQLKIKNTGKIDPKKHLESNIDDASANNIVQLLGNMMSARVL
ncbi:Mov34/MPN/PAD-1 family: proteasomal regulatory protein rpn11 and signalosome complex protein (macronuclear) [Tetrahymena thermophila SB210]|uniref:Mov34/MPN/PAD-1 family: proteasomal regulatory protein rpn11 and signalosome complex protein n=1 Tax=Tetrahymena thermophila (strain SB210) TaxID=312017 RepID=Q23D46_TETTS|nr:Mov34/MPN/PAD-1 family: proteasomal regulatory protein rpn11 and signalosome complex protein [Tetrahymena thermophila SB210]EAR94682.1 Mov34/MPN/PAD-1 family: proteasomal regulatory protein rpn11 and signalosome complex protein [Tetrahymena thermophila SB210]|eukprot:XP_001014840.1 Mov34/MPN/PAD-1 family: proteasomal regulatory protein rpn11 and signalosome complex protein [Tetrahymena thermophila SB210]